MGTGTNASYTLCLVSSFGFLLSLVTELSLNDMGLDTKTNSWKLYDLAVPAAIVLNPIPCDTGSQQTVQTAMRWIHNCTSRHSKCSSRKVTVLPTRLIDVVSLRLCETAGKAGTYACLSHRWGQGNDALTVPRTTKANIASMIEGLPWNMIPRTFREAIQFTRSLGIPYLWIDSLCIIQDDQLDWEREAAGMADVYMNCWVTLAASLSPNSNAGLFFQSNEDVGSCHVGAVRCQGMPPVPLFMHRRPSHDPHGGEIYPLSSRGWVVQESLLSPRTIYFIGREIIFECRHNMQCQCGVLKGPFLAIEQYTECTAQNNNAKEKCRTSSGTWDWNRIVSLYARTSLSFSKDTFPALSGIAKQVLAESPDDYLAGLWRSKLPVDLLWHHNSVDARRVRPWRAPSWSWASVESP
jgi:hypothetical protein